VSQAHAEVDGPPGAVAQEASQSAARTRSAGRGVLSITGAKLYFILAGYVVQILLPRLLGNPESFGLFSSAMNIVSILNNVLVASTIQSVSKQVSGDVHHAGATLRQGLFLQLGIGGALSFGLWSSANVLAVRVQQDALVAPLLEVAAIAVLSNALYAALIGALNGQERFVRQAALDATYTTLRTAFILVGATLGVLGAMAGFASAAVGVLLAALIAVGVGVPGRTLPWRRWLLFLAPLSLYQLFLSLTLLVDLNVIKGVVATMNQEAGMLPEAAAHGASRLVAFYRAAQTFAFVPYQLILSVTLVVFPMVSQAVSIGDAAATRGYIRAAMRFSLIVLLAIAAPVSGAASGVMRVAYPDEYLAGSGALAVLSLGTVCFALFAIGATIMSGAGSPRVPAAIAAVTVGLVVGCNVVFLRMAGVGEHSLIAAASGTTLGMTFAMIAIAIVVYRRFGVFLAPASATRIVASGALAWAVASALPNHSAILALLALVAGGVVYLLALLLTRELGRADFEIVRKIVRR
jgi:stage V sporulation protein B